MTEIANLSYIFLLYSDIAIFRFQKSSMISSLWKINYIILTFANTQCDLTEIYLSLLEF